MSVMDYFRTDINTFVFQHFYFGMVTPMIIFAIYFLFFFYIIRPLGNSLIFGDTMLRRVRVLHILVDTTE